MIDYQPENQEYISQLFGKNGEEARQYLKDRYINVATAKIWQLGFSPKNFIPQCYTNSDITFYKKMNGRIRQNFKGYGESFYNNQEPFVRSTILMLFNFHLYGILA